MSFDLTKRHLKADITRRAVIDSSIVAGLDQQPKKKSTQRSNASKTSHKSKVGRKITPKGAAKPVSKEYNPYIAAIDNSTSGKIKAFKRQLKSASGQISSTSSSLSFDNDDVIARIANLGDDGHGDDDDEKVLTPAQAKALRRANKGSKVQKPTTKLSAQAHMNLTFINHTSNKASKSEKAYVSKTTAKSRK